MKIRIKGDSLRYRLSKTDVETFTTAGYIEELTHFGEQKLTYALKRADSTELNAEFIHNKITLYMPNHLASQWALTNIVGFEGNDKGLYLLVEKDFQCLDNVDEDQSDNYPNPKTC